MVDISASDPFRTGRPHYLNNEPTDLGPGSAKEQRGCHIRFDADSSRIPINSQEHAMADDLKNRGAQDRSRISMHEEHEVRYWTKALGVSKEELASAVAKVGNSADAVRRELGK
jgi:hypothetical protein